jgi:nucleoside-diphosphate-sugar epimerase
LLEAEDLLADFNCPGTVLRLSGIYGPGRRRMLDLACQPQAWPQHNRWTNRIHRDDAAAFIQFLIHRMLKGESVDHRYLVTDNRPTPQYEVLLALAEMQGIKPSSIVVPPASGGKQLSNARMLSTGFALRYPDFHAGYADLLHST